MQNEIDPAVERLARNAKPALVLAAQLLAVLEDSGHPKSVLFRALSLTEGLMQTLPLPYDTEPVPLEKNKVHWFKGSPMPADFDPSTLGL